MLLAAIATAWRSLLWARAALKRLWGSSAQHRSTATRQGSGRSSKLIDTLSEPSDMVSANASDMGEALERASKGTVSNPSKVSDLQVAPCVKKAGSGQQHKLR